MSRKSTTKGKTQTTRRKSSSSKTTPDATSEAVTVAATQTDETTEMIPTPNNEVALPTASPTTSAVAIVEEEDDNAVPVAYEQTAEAARTTVRDKLTRAASTMLALVTLEASRVEDEMTAEIMLSLTERLGRINDLLGKKNPLLAPVLRQSFVDLVAQIGVLYQRAGLGKSDAGKAAQEAARSMVPNFAA